MFTEALRNFIHREVLRVLDRRSRRVPCLVDSYNPSQHTVKVKLQPEGTLTGWVQIQCDQVGWQIAPNIGDPGWIEFHEMDRRAAVFVASNHNDLNPPPAQIQAGEWRYQPKVGSGTFVYFKNDGSITLEDKAGSQVFLDGAGNIALNPKGGKVYVGGPVGSGVPASQQGTVDSGGFTDNSDLASKVNVS